MLSFVLLQTLVWMSSFSLAIAAPSAAPGSAASVPVSTAVVGIGSLMAKGDVGLTALKKYSFVSGKVLARDKNLTVYSGFRDPVFQVVLWGNKEKPDRVLIEYEPKKQSITVLTEFNTDWNARLPAGNAQSAKLNAFSKENAAHLSAYCAKLPSSAHCEVQTWTLPGVGKVVRLDIHLAMGPQVPKAIEFERKK